MIVQLNRLVAIGLVLGAAWAAPGHAECHAPLGILDSLLVQGHRLESIDMQRFFVQRDGHDLFVDIGAPLCEGDHLATLPDTTANLLVGPAEGPRQGLTVLPGTTAILRTVSRVELLIGRLIGAVHGNFDVVMPFATLAATGTEFEVEATPQGCRVEQLEGTTHLTTAQSAIAVLDRLKSASCTPEAITTILEIEAERCQALIKNSSRIMAAARPAVQSSNAIRQFKPAEADAAYAAAREAAICRNDVAARQTVERVLVDWDRPQEALAGPGAGIGDAGAQDQIALGRALLMRGKSGDAIAQFDLAVAQAGATVATTTGFGDAERDLGLAAIRAGSIAQAAQHFESAIQRYRDALGQTQDSGKIGVILVNLGDLALLRIKLDPDAAEARLTQARTYYESARQHGDPPHARLGLARISVLRAQLIPTQQVDATAGSAWNVFGANLLLAILAEQQRKPYRQAARTELSALISSVPGFAPAEELLGEVLYASGDLDRSRKSFRRAIAADPGNTSAYLAYSKTLHGDGKKLYENTYRLVEVPAVRELANTRREILMPTAETVTIPPAPLVADSAKLGFSSPEGRNRVVTMTNRSATPATVASVNVTGSRPDVFRVVSNGCGNGSIAPGAECRIMMEFTAESTGSYRATLELTFVGGSLTREVKLIGEVPPPPIG